MKNEIWRPVVGFEGYYECSNLGRVRSVRTNKILSQFKRGNYYTVEFYRNCVETKMYVHRLVAQAFIPNPNNYPMVNHKDENSENNCADNLEWCDAKYNANYGTRNKRLKSIPKNNSPKTVYQYSLDGKYITEYHSTREAAEIVGLHHTIIGKCCRGITKTCGGYIWKYQ